VFEAIKVVMPLFDKLFRSGKAYRLTGTVLFKLKPDTEAQYSLFDDMPRIKSLKELDRVIDGAGARYGKHTLHLGSSTLAFDEPAHRTSRGELPERKKDLLAGETSRKRLGVPMWRVKV
jgi:DNA polymerase-4/DNA polymerase V